MFASLLCLTTALAQDLAPARAEIAAVIADPEERSALQAHLLAQASAVSARLSPRGDATPDAIAQLFVDQVTASLAAKRADLLAMDADRLRRTVIDYEAFKMEALVTSGVYPRRYFGYFDGERDTADLERRMMSLIHHSVRLANALQAEQGRTVRITDAEVTITWVSEGGALLLGDEQEKARSDVPRLHPILAVGLDDIAHGFTREALLVERLDAAFGTGLAELVAWDGETPYLTRHMTFDETILGTLVMYIWEKEICERKLAEAGRAPLQSRSLTRQFILSSLVYNSGILFSESRMRQIERFDTADYLFSVSEKNAESRWRLPVVPPGRGINLLVDHGDYWRQPTSWSTVSNVLQRYGGWAGMMNLTDVFDSSGTLRAAEDWPPQPAPQAAPPPDAVPSAPPDPPAPGCHHTLTTAGWWLAIFGIFAVLFRQMNTRRASAHTPDRCWRRRRECSSSSASVRWISTRSQSTARRDSSA